MSFELRKLLPYDGRDIYDMLQQIPRDENGYNNAVNGMLYEEYKDWLIKREQDSRKTELEDGWKVPQSTF